MKKILVCEDEAAIREFIVLNLKNAGYNVFAAANAEEAIQIYQSGGGKFDVAVLDIMMSGMDGTELCRWIREKSHVIGIIMLSAKTQEYDKINCLSLGADDYITKPFSPSELVARVDAIYRRVSILRPQANEDCITSPPFILDVKNRTLSKNSLDIELTQVEFQLMELFLKNKGFALDRKTILHRIWGENYFGDEKIVDVNIRRLRIKIEDNPSSPLYIQTIWGFGYKWEEI